LNGILKQEYGLGCSFRIKKQALAADGEAVFPCNTRRPHLSLKMKRLKIRAVGLRKYLSTYFRTCRLAKPRNLMLPAKQSLSPKN
jgi:hypothetical protein